MAKRMTVMSLLTGVMLALLLGSGCGPSTELSGSPIPNQLPQTEVTARPPDILEAGFVVQFYWTGFDPDGRIDRYQWKISNNGTDGISIQDTLTFDPVTGDTLNPWYDTVATDSTFLVTADLPDFPGDPEGYTRYWQTHTFFVRCIDNDNGADPTPAAISFNSTTLLPTVNIMGPGAITGQGEAFAVPKTVTFVYEGTDPDFDSGLPTKIRYMWKKALLPNGDYCDTRNDFNSNTDFLVSFDDSLWTDWEAYGLDEDERRITLPNQPQVEADPDNPGEFRNIFYLFAIQAQDTAGAVSIDRRYGYQVANVRITTGKSPLIDVLETFLGRFSGSGSNLQRSLDVAAGQELNFSWVADASGYEGEIISYRYGWDITDVTDPNDPNWAVAPGNTVQHRRAQPKSFPSGVHTLTIQTVDNSEQITRIVITLDVVPVPDPSQQRPLLYVDDLNDQSSQAWPSDPSLGTSIPLDQDPYRDLFWFGTLSGPGGVSAYDSLTHTVDTETEQVEYRDVVNYQALVWATKWVNSQTSNAIAGQFRPVDPQQSPTGSEADQYIWLSPYQESVGNVLLAGNRIMNAFLAESRYELPIVFESREGDENGFVSIGGNNVQVRRGFGERELPDGSAERVGLSRYPFSTIGISVLDIMSPNSTYTEYNQTSAANARRKKSCVSMKVLILDQEFKNNNLAGGSTFPDSIYTSPQIDWQDEVFPDDRDVLDFSYIWSNDEFYNTDAVGRNTNYTIQYCGPEEEEYPCIEPMWRSRSRFDWIQDERLKVDPDDTWPSGYYGGPGQPILDSLCGARALGPNQTQAITNDRVVGFITHKTAPFKPSEKGDVVFGFDPYRYHDSDSTRPQHMAEVIRWVLGEHFGLQMNP